MYFIMKINFVQGSLPRKKMSKTFYQDTLKSFPVQIFFVISTQSKKSHKTQCGNKKLFLLLVGRKTNRNITLKVLKFFIASYFLKTQAKYIPNPSMNKIQLSLRTFLPIRKKRQVQFFCQWRLHMSNTLQISTKLTVILIEYSRRLQHFLRKP